MKASIEQAVILAAGRGSRLETVSGGTPKSLVPVAGRPLLFRMLDNLQARGVCRTVMAVGYRADEFRNALGADWRGMEIVYALNEKWDTTNNIVSLLHTLPHITGDFYMLEADIYCTPDQLKRLHSPGMAAVAPFEPHMDGTVVSADAAGTITEFLLKDDPARPDDCTSLLKTVNIYSLSLQTFSGIIVPAMERLVVAGGTGVYYEKAMAAAVADGSLHLETAVFDNTAWGEMDDPDDKQRAESFFSRASRNG